MTSFNHSSNLFLKPVKSYVNLNSINFYCDFETVLVNDIHYVSCFSIVGPRVHYSKSLSFPTAKNVNMEAESSRLVLTFIKTCQDLKKNVFLTNNTKVIFLFHNFSKFDSFFLINSLSRKKKFEVKLVTRNRTIYKMLVEDLSDKNVQLEFRDTYLLLSISLNKIGHIFCKEYKKIKFDHSQNTLEIYTSNKFFRNKKKKVEVYCLNDSLVLKEGFEHFIEKIKSLLFVNPLVCLSLPSLAMKIFLKDFYDLKKNPIENCTGNKETFIRKSYKGGTVDVFKPHMKKGYHYDINSLYPYVMREFKYPVGKGAFVRANEINFDTFFGFLEVIVYCPKSIKIPLLTKYDKLKGLICPSGKWRDVYFSEELKVAKSFGYKFEIIRGVSYEKKKIFVDIITKLHDLRSEYAKNSPSNTIVKLLMNSLYGRFGMKTRLPVTKIVSEKEYNEIQAIYNVLDQTELNQKIVVVFINKPVVEKLDLLLKFNLITRDKYDVLKRDATTQFFFTSIQIASAIASYARIIIHKYKSDLKNEIYYSDTDSIFCKYPVHKRYLSDTKLGFLKKCGVVKEAYFIAPKIYGCLYSNKFDITCKGVNKGLVSFQDIKILYTGEKKSFINILPFKKNYKKFIIKKIEQKIDISGNFLKRKKSFTKGKWTSTFPHTLT